MLPQDLYVTSSEHWSPGLVAPPLIPFNPSSVNLLFSISFIIFIILIDLHLTLRPSWFAGRFAKEDRNIFLLLLPLFCALGFLAIENPKIESRNKLVQCLTVLSGRERRLWLLRLFPASLLRHLFPVSATGAHLARTFSYSHITFFKLNTILLPFII